MTRFLIVCIIAIYSNVAYDNTNVYGVGAFLLAVSELYQLNKK